MNKTMLFTIFLLLLFSCERDSGSLDPYFTESGLGYGHFTFGDTVTLPWHCCLNDPENQMYICLDSVMSDSRCPKGVECFWAGNAGARFRFGKINGQHVLFELNTNLQFRNDTILSGYKFTLVELSPYPDIRHQTKQKDYKASLLIVKE
ncbi:MAG: hypothetical protein Q8868_14065 [Bacteroidota bacterium]|nr:hypothetical protein [Bacteroidota bacterium]